jgi:Flp pilus assembly protein TadG
MRVVLSRIRVRRNHDEQGAVAIVVALMTVMLCVIAAMVVDFGQAYVNKRQAQTAADAAVLAASKIYAGQTGSCATLVANATLRAQALTAANTLREQNLPGSRGVNFDVTCNADQELQVAYDVEADSAVGLGALAINSDHMIVSREATATFDRPMRGDSGMRPWPICSNSVNTTNTHVTQVLAGNNENAGCPAMADISGTWSRFACPGFAKGDGSDKDDKPTSTMYWIRYGCPNPASPIPGQPTDPSALTSHLINHCSVPPIGKNDPSTEFCLTRDTGKAQNKKMDDAWQMVVDEGETIEVPIFCSSPQCSYDAVTAAPVIPIYQLAVVRVCGFYLDGTHSDWSTHAECTGANNPKNYSETTEPPAGKNAFYLVFKGIIKSTDNGADGGSSNLRLTE